MKTNYLKQNYDTFTHQTKMQMVIFIILIDQSLYMEDNSLNITEFVND